MHQGKGATLAERLGLRVIAERGGRLQCGCCFCDSSDALYVKADSGAHKCQSCGANGGALPLAEKVIGDHKAAIALLVEVGIFEPPTNGHSSNGHAHDPLAAVATAKRVTVESLKAYGAEADDGAVVFPMYDRQGARCSEFRLTPREGDKGKYQKGEPVGLFLPQTPQPGETWHVVEGVKDAAALHGLGLLAAGLPRNAMAAKFARLFAGCEVIVIPDRDNAGETGADQTASALHGVAASVRMATLPMEFRKTKGPDVRDLLAQPNGRELLLQAIADAKPWQPPATPEDSAEDCRPKITLGPDEHIVNDAAVAALAADKSLYQRGGLLVHIVQDAAPQRGIQRPKDAPRVVPVPSANLRERLSAVAKFVRIGRDEKGTPVIRRVDVPGKCAVAVEARGQWQGIRYLEGVTDCPILRPDGSVLTTPGYDGETGLLYLGERFPLPIGTTQEEAKDAIGALLAIVRDFPFTSDEHRAAWVSFLLTAFARVLFEGPAPLFAIDANTRGSGKSKLADAVAIILTGRDMPRMSCPEDDAEFRKQILAVAIEADQLLLIDNVAREFGSPALDCALTATSVKGRILGRTEMVSMPMRVIWAVTANNLALAGDTARRTVHIRLQSPLENPEEREGFEHPDLLGWIRAERHRLVAAALTVLRAYILAGKPSMRLKPWGSFEGWSDMVRSAIVWAGLPDPGATRRELARKSDRETEALRAVLHGWAEFDYEGNGLTAAAILDRLGKAPSLYIDFRAALWDLCNAHNKVPTSTSIGRRLGRAEGRVIDGMAIDYRDSRDGVKVWFVASLDKPSAGSAGSAGGVFNPSRTRKEEEEIYMDGINPRTPCNPRREFDEVATFMDS